MAPFAKGARQEPLQTSSDSIRSETWHLGPEVSGILLHSGKNLNLVPEVGTPLYH